MNNWNEEDKFYHMNNGLIALMAKGVMYVCRYNNISEETLIKLGYKFSYGKVPLSDGEGYYKISDLYLYGQNINQVMCRIIYRR